MKIKNSEIVIFIIFLNIMSIPYLSQTTNNILTLCEGMLLILLCLSKNLKSFLKNNMFIFPFLIIIFLSTFINYGFSSRTMTAIVFCVQLFSTYFSVFSIIKKESFYFFVRKILKILLIVLIIVDLFILITAGKGFGGNDVLPLYLIGNKFIVSYLHLISLACVMCFTNIKKDKFFLFSILFVISIIICKIIDCNTGIVGCFVIFILNCLIIRKFKFMNFIFNEKLFIIIFLIANFLVVGSNILIENKFFNYIIVNYFHRSSDLTGRIEMFELTISAIKNKLVLGYGINSTFVQDILSWGNAQNGLLKMMLDFGCLGTLGFFILCYNSIKKCNKNFSKFFMIFLCSMLVCSTVEINISGIFYLALAIVNASKYDLGGINVEKNMYFVNAKS